MPPPAPQPVPLSPAEESRWLLQEAQPHERDLRGYLRHRFPSIETDDVVQESYLKLLKARAAGRVASARAFFFTVARNTALTLFRRERIYVSTPIADLPENCLLDPAGDAAQHADAREKLALVTEAIGQLPGRCREVVSLATLDGLSYEEISERLGITEATARVQMRRGLLKVGEFLRTKGERR